MNRTQFQKLMEKEFQTLLDINDRKGHDYAGDDDALANFKGIAARMGLTPEQVWGVYANKHLDAIMTYIREGDVQSEPIEGRIHDAILYLFLLMGLVVEAKERQQNPLFIYDDVQSYRVRAIPVGRVDIDQDGMSAIPVRSEDGDAA